MNHQENERRQRTIRIIQAMLDRTVENGCTPAEAARAADKVKELLEKYQLSMVDIQQKKFNESLFRLNINTAVKKQNPGDVNLLDCICRSYNCKLIISRHNGFIVYCVMGFESDVQVAKSVFLYTLENLNKKYLSEKKPDNIHGIKYRNSYMFGATSIISERLQQGLEERKKLASECETGNALVVLNALAEIKKPAVDKFVESQFPKLKKGKVSKSEFIYEAYQKGKVAGEQVDLARKI